MTSTLADRVEEAIDWLDPGAGGVPDECFEDGRLDRPAAHLRGWVASGVGEHAWLRPDRLHEEVSLLVRLAERSGSEATEVRSRLVSALFQRAPDLTVGHATAPDAQAGAGIRRWALLPAGARPSEALLLAWEAERAPVLSLAGESLAGAPRHRLIGLEGLELVDLTTVEHRSEPPLSEGDRVAAALAAARGELLDCAVDLGIAIGFVRRIGEYLTRDWASGEDLSAVEQSVLERLGAAHAELGVVSESLREVLAAAPGGTTEQELWDWRQTIASERGWSSLVHARLLSDLFELAGASATSQRLGLDRNWRDFVARQAVFPPPGAADPAIAITRRSTWRPDICIWR